MVKKARFRTSSGCWLQMIVDVDVDVGGCQRCSSSMSTKSYRTHEVILGLRLNALNAAAPRHREQCSEFPRQQLI